MQFALTGFLRTSERFVGGDAHIAPFVAIEFAKNLHQSDTFCRVDVGIAPYA